MKYCRFRLNGSIRHGVITDDGIMPVLRLEVPDQSSWSPKDLIEPAAVSLLPPVSPSKIVCVGRNYAGHARELGNEVPEEPLLFLKAPSSIIADGEAIAIPSQSKQVEHEGELAIIIGRTCSRIDESRDVSSFVFGLTCLNDVTARDLQKKDGQFARAKSFDTFCPVGPYIETEFALDGDRRVAASVNGEVRQEGNTGQMVFSPSLLVRYVSNQMTLEPGDIIATGTPSGVSRLNPGDVVEVSIEGIGKLGNPVVDRQNRT